ncbi:MAG: NADH-quinone oxidoreductase subunit C [Methanoregulaceae archaeon]|jgi:NADH-quinone oxidoreductase subunit C
MTDPLTLGSVTEAMNGVGTAEQVSRNRIRIKTNPGRLHKSLLLAHTILTCDHLIQISAVDNGTIFELIYHMTGPHQTVISIAVELPREKPEVMTTSGIMPASGIYERQIHDLMGIEFKGHPGLTRLILNEDWPKNEYPMRKDWKPDPGTFYGGIRGET